MSCSTSRSSPSSEEPPREITFALLNASSRTSKYIIQHALEANINIRAIVRSVTRFGPEKYDNPLLKVHQLDDFQDVNALRDLLADVESVFITLAGSSDEKTTLYQDFVQTVVAAIRSLAVEQRKSPTATGHIEATDTNIVLLSSDILSPLLCDNAVIKSSTQLGLTPLQSFLRNHIVRHMYDDLSRAQKYLEKQSSWLDWTVVTPGQILDVTESPEITNEWTASSTQTPTTPISYNRLAAAMLSIASDQPHWNHKFVSPLAKTPIRFRISDFSTLRSVLVLWLRSQILKPALQYSIIFLSGILCSMLFAFCRTIE